MPEEEIEEQEATTEEETPPTEEEQTPEEPCDPAIMSCDQMRDKILDLSEQRVKYDDTIKKLDDVKAILPSEEINKAYDNALAKKQDIDDEIYNIFEKFTVCTTKPPEEPKETEETL